MTLALIFHSMALFGSPTKEPDHKAFGSVLQIGSQALRGKCLKTRPRRLPDASQTHSRYREKCLDLSGEVFHGATPDESSRLGLRGNLGRGV